MQSLDPILKADEAPKASPAGGTGNSLPVLRSNKRSSIVRPLKLTGYGAKIDLNGPMWQPKYYTFNVFSPAKAREKLVYMHNNPVTAGLVQKAEDWRFSSASWYLLNRSVGVQLTPLR